MIDDKMRAYKWDNDEQVRPILEQLMRHEPTDTRTFLRPIFKWLKLGIRKTGEREESYIDKAFDFVDWMVQLTRHGDPSRGISCMEELQPAYAINTIITIAQRAGSLVDAKRAFKLFEVYNYEPDVFTHTALMDVMARNGNVDDAIQEYENMRLTRKAKPNIITFTTIIRALALSETIDASLCLKYLEHARESETFVTALYFEALDVCVTRRNLDTLTLVLHDMKKNDEKLRHQEPQNSQFIATIALLFSDGQLDKMQILSEWELNGLITAIERRLIEMGQPPQEVVNPAKSLGCLGNHTAESVREAVIQHDLQRLLYRIESGPTVTIDDFETLLHQCRKRKWKEEVAVIVETMDSLSKNGWPANPKLPIQPHLMPTLKTHTSAIETYLICGDEPAAWNVFSNNVCVKRDHFIYRKYINGVYLLRDNTHVVEVLRMAVIDEVTFSHRMAVKVARLYGTSPEKGLDIILNRLPQIQKDPMRKTMLEVITDKSLYVDELLLSCAYNRNVIGLENLLQSMRSCGLKQSYICDLAVVTCCLQEQNLQTAKIQIERFQNSYLIINTPVYFSLAREMYLKFARSSPLSDTGRSNIIQVLQQRRIIFQRLFEERQFFLDFSKAWSQAHPVEELSFWCSSAERVLCSNLMFVQHVIELLASIREKSSKIATESMIRNVLLTNASDPLQFILECTVALQYFDLTYRNQGKLAKQLLMILTDENKVLCSSVTVKKMHQEYALRNANFLSIHIIKEMDEVLKLRESEPDKILSFCMDALNKGDNVDKIISFLSSSQKLFTLKTVELLSPIFADLYVNKRVPGVLQFFRYKESNTDNDTESNNFINEGDYMILLNEMRGAFLRVVIEYEKGTILERNEDALDDTESSMTSCDQPLPLATKAIVEFKMEHEPEFLPFLIRAKFHSFNTNASIQANSTAQSIEYLQFPIPTDSIIIVDDDSSVAAAYELLMYGSDAEEITAIGIDAEWRPDGRSTLKLQSGYSYMARSPVSVLQIATSTNLVFLFDLIAVPITDLEELFTYLFGEERIVRLGFRIDGDLNRLKLSFPQLACFDNVPNIRDFALESFNFQTNLTSSKDGRLKNFGLSTLVQHVLGQPLCKVQQRSDWEARPLTWDQILYAALDAYCLLMIQNKLADKL